MFLRMGVSFSELCCGVELIKGQSICFPTMRFEFCREIGLEVLLT
jgi:hypothetical protein